jgi:glutaredoxin
MTKEMLASWGVEFDAINVAGDTDAMREIVRLGAPLVPAVAYDGKIVHGWNPAGYAKLLGVAYSGVPALSPQELARRMDAILATIQRWLRIVPTGTLRLEGPGRRRELRQLAYHVFRLSAAFVDAMENDGLHEAWLQEEAPDSVRTGAHLAAFGDKVRARVREWFAAHPSVVWQDAVWTYYGEQSAHELLERTTWHGGQHFRQIHDLLSRAGAIPADALDPDLLAKLPMPKELW